MIQRRDFLRLAAGGAAALQLHSPALALDYPNKAVRVAVTTAPGGTSDFVTRLTSKFLAEKLGQPFIIENQPGAGGNIAAGGVARAAADGYSLLSISKGNVLANLLYDKLNFDFMRDFVPVASIATGGLVMLLHPSVPVRTLPEFLAYAKANPGKINYSTPGMGSDPHLGAELLKMMAGIELTHVPYRGGALALTDLISGNVQMMFSNLPVGEFIRTGKLAGIGVTSLDRNAEFPELPPIADAVPGFEVNGWYAYVARRETPPDIIKTLNNAMIEALSDPAVQKGISTLNAKPMPLNAAELEKLFREEFERWGKVIKTANIRLN